MEFQGVFDWLFAPDSGKIWRPGVHPGSLSGGRTWSPDEGSGAMSLSEHGIPSARLQAEAHDPEVQARIAEAIREGLIRVVPAPGGGIRILPRLARGVGAGPG